MQEAEGRFWRSKWANGQPSSGRREEAQSAAPFDPILVFVLTHGLDRRMEEYSQETRRPGRVIPEQKDSIYSSAERPGSMQRVSLEGVHCCC